MMAGNNMTKNVFFLNFYYVKGYFNIINLFYNNNTLNILKVI